MSLPLSELLLEFGRFVMWSRRLCRVKQAFVSCEAGVCVMWSRRSAVQDVVEF